MEDTFPVFIILRVPLISSYSNIDRLSMLMTLNILHIFSFAHNLIKPARYLRYGYCPLHSLVGNACD